MSDQRALEAEIEHLGDEVEWREDERREALIDLEQARDEIKRLRAGVEEVAKTPDELGPGGRIAAAEAVLNSPYGARWSSSAEEVAPGLSAAATGHLQVLMVHRDDLDELTVVIHPGRCDLCAEIRLWLGTSQHPSREQQR